MIILAINPGSTSTKVALYNDLELTAQKKINHSSKELSRFETLSEEIPFRKQLILTFISENNVTLQDIDGFIGRGGLMKPIKSGIYKVNEQMIKDLKSETYGTHASNLGGLLAHDLAKQVGKDAFIADPVVVDEMSSVAKISGLNGIERKSIWHALNQKAVAKKYAARIGMEYDEINLIVAHLGGGISVGLHKRGRVTDVNNALNGEGPMTPERTGGLPVGAVYEMALSGQYTLEQLQKMNYGFGGLVSYLGTNNAEEVSDRIASGEVFAKRVMKAMVYQIAKEIGSLYAVTRNNLDAIIITGGLAYNQDVLQPLLEYIDHLGDIVVYPGEDELEALAHNMYEYLRAPIDLRNYE